MELTVFEEDYVWSRNIRDCYLRLFPWLETMFVLPPLLPGSP